MIRFKQLLSAVLLGVLTGACAAKKESKLTYPAAVVAAHQAQQYRTALWCAYTYRLDSAVFRQKTQLDSIQVLQRQLLAVPRHLEQIEKRGESIRFEFGQDFKSPAELALLEKLCGYAHNSLSPVSAVWVNEQDGLIDSVLDYNGRIRSAGPPTSFPGKRAMPWNRDQPCKAAFLQQNKAWLTADLRQLCQDKHLVSR